MPWVIPIWVSSISNWYLLSCLFHCISHVAIPAFTPVKNLLSIIISKDLAIWLNPDKTAAMITKTLLTSRDIFLQREETQLWAQMGARFGSGIKPFTWQIQPALPASSVECSAPPQHILLTRSPPGVPMHRSALRGVVSKTGICINRKSTGLTQLGPLPTTSMTMGCPCRAGFRHMEGTLGSSPRLTALALPIWMGKNISVFSIWKSQFVETGTFHVIVFLGNFCQNVFKCHRWNFCPKPEKKGSSLDPYQPAILSSPSGLPYLLLGIFLLFTNGMILLLSSTRWNFSLDKKGVSFPDLHNHGKSGCGRQSSDPTPKHRGACVST